MLFILLRRLGVRGRIIVGLVLAGAGVVLIAVSLVAVAGLLIHGVIMAVIGGAVLGSAMASRRRARLASQADAGEDPNLSVHAVRRSGE